MYTSPYQHLFDAPFHSLSPKHFFWSKRLRVTRGVHVPDRLKCRLEHLRRAWKELYYILRQANAGSTYEDVRAAAKQRTRRMPTRRSFHDEHLSIGFECVFWTLGGFRTPVDRPLREFNVSGMRKAYAEACSQSFQLDFEQRFDFI